MLYPLADTVNHYLTGAEEFSTSGLRNLQPAWTLAIECELALNRMPAVAPERSGFLSRAGASGSHHLPWALPRIVHAHQAVPSAPGGGSGQSAHRELAAAC
jgi:hypothetical protein